MRRQLFDLGGSHHTCDGPPENLTTASRQAYAASSRDSVMELSPTTTITDANVLAETRRRDEDTSRRRRRLEAAQAEWRRSGSLWAACEACYMGSYLSIVDATLDVAQALGGALRDGPRSVQRVAGMLASGGPRGPSGAESAPAPPKSPPPAKVEKVSMLRSEPMVMVQMIVQADAASETLEELGSLSSIMFTDLHEGMSVHKRQFVLQLRECDEVERCLRLMKQQMAAFGHAQDPPRPPSADEALPALPTNFPVFRRHVLDVLSELKQLRASRRQLETQYERFVEHSLVLQKMELIFVQATSDSAQALAPQSPVDLEDGTPRSKVLDHLVGTVARERLGAFERSAFRLTFGNVYFRHADIDEAAADPLTLEPLARSAFVMFFHPGRNARKKLSALGDAYGVRRYNIPHRHQERVAELSSLQASRAEMKVAIEQAQGVHESRLKVVLGQLPTWQRIAIKQRACFQALNLCSLDVTQHCLIAQCWCPASMLNATREAVRRGAVHASARMESIVNVIDARKETPPTYFRTNKFTAGFQGIVDGYGIPRYGEINPATFTIITYPFLFGVMFGDVGHGIRLASEPGGAPNAG